MFPPQSLSKRLSRVLHRHGYGPAETIEGVEAPHRLLVLVDGSSCTVSAEAAERLHKRRLGAVPADGKRLQPFGAPMRETLAAGCVMHLGRVSMGAAADGAVESAVAGLNKLSGTRAA